MEGVHQISLPAQCFPGSFVAGCLLRQPSSLDHRPDSSRRPLRQLGRARGCGSVFERPSSTCGVAVVTEIERHAAAFPRRFFLLCSRPRFPSDSVNMQHDGIAPLWQVERKAPCQCPPAQQYCQAVFQLVSPSSRQRRRTRRNTSFPGSRTASAHGIDEMPEQRLDTGFEDCLHRGRTDASIHSGRRAHLDGLVYALVSVLVQMAV
ncbi:hypothetical protein TGDOM2_401750 [Toxoplasma gondii GAB2-2007-GAL-DOM2]|uniref:Uncharacterized protein n=1 Tax=Toxoplasma gondii GAB2-2007-GAL-DOM2 TaxID=1130820 RepID=A0A086JAA2_TOXGO|nr:hypothetical protein TGDOM2_401750 [Toxoplasma gondii GAB2-2007-GAL-DOM2]